MFYVQSAAKTKKICMNLFLHSSLKTGVLQKEIVLSGKSVRLTEIMQKILLKRISLTNIFRIRLMI